MRGRERALGPVVVALLAAPALGLRLRVVVRHVVVRRGVAVGRNLTHRLVLLLLGLRCEQRCSMPRRSVPRVGSSARARDRNRRRGQAQLSETERLASTAERGEHLARSRLDDDERQPRDEALAEAVRFLLQAAESALRFRPAASVR